MQNKALMIMVIALLLMLSLSTCAGGSDDVENKPTGGAPVSFEDQIAPFSWIDHEDGSASVTLYSSDKYKKKLFRTRRREGFVGSGYDWESLAQTFLHEKAPELQQTIEFDPEHLMFCAYSSDLDALRRFVLLFKETCENKELIAAIFSRALPQEKITKEMRQSVRDQIREWRDRKSVV